MIGGTRNINHVSRCEKILRGKVMKDCDFCKHCEYEVKECYGANARSIVAGCKIGCVNNGECEKYAEEKGVRE